MVDSGGGILIGVVGLGLTLFTSLTVNSLRQASWIKIEEAFALRKRPGRADILRQLALRLIHICTLLRMCAHLVVVLAVTLFALNTFKHVAHPTLLLAIFIICTLVLSLFAVSLPQAWAKYGGNCFLVAMYPLLVGLAKVGWPLDRLSVMVEPVVKRLAGVSEESADDLLEQRQEELLNVVEEGKKEGVVDQEEHEMIESVLEFRDTGVGEIMTPRTEVIGIEANTPLSEVLDLILESGYSRYPVYEENIDKVIGMLYAKDLLRDLKHAPDKSAGIRDRLRQPFFVPETKPLRDLLHDFQNHKVHMAIVLDEYGGTAGIVTIEDIIEQLVGEIVDEYERPEPPEFERVEENIINVDARCHVDEFNDEFGANLPEDDDYDTVGGFLIARLGRIPANKETYAFDGLRFVVLDAEPRRINRLRIEKLPPAETDE